DRADANMKNPNWVWPELLMGREEGGDVDAKRLLPERWPEIALAHSDCFACHHDLKYPGFRQVRGFGYHVPNLPLARVVPGRPIVRSWPLAGLEVALKQGDKAAELDALKTRLDSLAKACSLRPFGDREQVGASADELIKWCDVLIEGLRNPQLYTRKNREKLLLNLCTLYAGDEKERTAKGFPAIPDYETARQIGSLI